MDTSESPVRHDQQLIAGPRLGDDCPDEPLQIALDAGAIAERRERIVEVVLALKVPAEQPDGAAMIEYFETARAVHPCVPPIAHSKPFHRAPAAASEDAVNRRVGTVDYEFAGPGYGSDEMMELSLNRCKIGEDVGMIELYIVQNR